MATERELEYIKVALKDKFEKLYSLGLSKKHIAKRLGISLGSLKIAFGTVCFFKRGNIKPKWMNKDKWVKSDPVYSYNGTSAEEYPMIKRME